VLTTSKTTGSWIRPDSSIEGRKRISVSKQVLWRMFGSRADKLTGDCEKKLNFEDVGCLGLLTPSGFVGR
jgi:hypothetical protein